MTVEGSQANTNVTDLITGTEYSFRVVAVSTSGSVSAESPASEVLVAVTNVNGMHVLWCTLLYCVCVYVFCVCAIKS